MTVVRAVLTACLMASHGGWAAVDFNKEVRPILSDRCFACHGPDIKKREAGLQMDTFESATAILKSGKRAIVPGKSGESELVNRIHTSDPDDIMPPSKLNRPLSAMERSILVKWIDEGAQYARHWAFLPPAKHNPPRVQNTTWPKDELDRFILANLEREKLAPNPEADRATLLRRVSLALTGLPPTPAQVDAFIRDQSPDAYEKQVDGLLGSPRFGERMAQDWLDLARFADTFGYQSDNNCFVWPWRDWVIRAYNKNLAYDKFLTWQIAGDLLPNATVEQRLATLFNRLHRQTQEGGSIEEEFRQEYVSDRVHTFGTAILGLTLECSKCHDHKYDPITMTDYYGLCAMFGQVDECGLFPYSISTTAPEPSMRLEEPHHGPEIALRRSLLDQARQKAGDVASTRTDAFNAWLRTSPGIQPPPPSDHFTLDSIIGGKLPNSISNGAPGSMSGGSLVAVAGAVNGAMQFDGDTILQLDGIKNIQRHQPLSVSLWMFSPERKQRSLIFHTGASLYSQSGDASGYELLLESGRLRWSCIHLWPGCAASIETRRDFPVGQWVHVTVTYDGSSTAAGLHLYFDGQPVETEVLHDHLDKSIITEIMRVGSRPRDDRGFADGRIDDIQVFHLALSAVEVAALHRSDSAATTVAAAQSGNPAARDLLRAHFLSRIDPEYVAAFEAIVAARKHLEDDYLHKIPLIMTMKESPTPRKFHVLTRGDYASPDTNRPVEASGLGGVMAFPPELPRNRLGLAQWMIHPDNPLVARVAVNRLWMQCFGAGIVPTQENFGMQGDAPAHPELLATLAYDFSHTGWDVKQMLKRMVMSATYRQSSSTTLEKREKDPRNLWLCRGPSFRLSGEVIRDQALYAAGLLVEKMGGPSVKPWQPPGIWSEAGASGGDYQPDKGEGLYRRSLYTFRKRTAPPPNMLTLDAGSREICQPRRLNTNTPLQPLVFLNDQSFFECARFLARRTIRENPAGIRDQLQGAYLLLTARTPSQPEIAALDQLHSRQRQFYTDNLVAAKAVCGEEDPAMAAMTIVCSTLLTTDATLTTR